MGASQGHPAVAWVKAAELHFLLKNQHGATRQNQNQTQLRIDLKCLFSFLISTMIFDKFSSCSQMFPPLIGSWVPSKVNRPICPGTSL